MIVRLLSYTRDPIETVARACAICYNTDIKNNSHSKRLIKNAITRGHESVIEHVSFNFKISCASRVWSHQEVRHRISSISQQSQRYVNAKNFKYVVPPSISDKPAATEKFKNLMFMIWKGYEELVEMGIPKEDARYLLPNACTTEMIHTFNVRSLRNFLNLRLDKHAQWEIRRVAWCMVKCICEIGCTIFIEDIVLKEIMHADFLDLKAAGIHNAKKFRSNIYDEVLISE